MASYELPLFPKAHQHLQQTRLVRHRHMTTLAGIFSSPDVIDAAICLNSERSKQLVTCIVTHMFQSACMLRAAIHETHNDFLYGCAIAMDFAHSAANLFRHLSRCFSISFGPIEDTH